MWTVEPVTLTSEERAELERRVRALTTSHRDRVRAEVVLLCADGVAGNQVAPRVGLSKQAVCKWRRCLVGFGIDGLLDAPRSGRPLVYGRPSVSCSWPRSPRSIPTSTRNGATPSLSGLWPMPGSASPPPRSGAFSPPTT